jgi:hypothetical protein
MNIEGEMKYRVMRSDGSIVGTYDASSEDEVLGKISDDANSGFPSREAAEGAAMDGLIRLEGVE